MMSSINPGRHRKSWRAAWLALAALLLPLQTSARPFRPGQMPNGNVFGCLTCHNSSSGGSRNPFGQAVGAIVRPGQPDPFWSPTLAALDSDGDGFTNGRELGDPDGDGTAIPGASVTNPGNASSKPANQAPTITLTSPADGAVLEAPAIAAVTATAADADGSVVRVEFLGNGESLGVVTEPPYSLLVDWALGAHTVTAQVTDDLGATSTSDPISLTVNLPAPPVIEGFSRGTDGTLELTWSGGGGPYAVQTRGTVTDPWCAVGAVVTNRSQALSAVGTAGFFRVADLAALGPIPLTAVIGGAFERPDAVTGEGAGSGAFTLEGNTLRFDIQYSGLSGTATAAHIHGAAGMDASAGVMINLAPFNGGSFGSSGSLAGSVILTAEQKAAILGGRTYVNVHTEAHPGGEVRGQILPVTMQAVLSGASERPAPVATAGAGYGLFRLRGSELRVEISYQGLSGPATRAHIHGPADTETSAGVLIDLAPLHVGEFGVSGGFSGAITLTPDQLVTIASGLSYVNVHTAANAPGEIRGQILPCVSALPLEVAMSGADERPEPVDTTGSGSGLLALEGDTLLLAIGYQGLSGAAVNAHIHGPAEASETAGVLIGLVPFSGPGLGVQGRFAGRALVTSEQKEALLAGRTYVNVHTGAHAAGEIRGQILRPTSP